MEEKQKKYLDLALWAGQVLLATSLIKATYVKLSTSLPVLYEMWPWTRNNWSLSLSILADVVAAVAIFFPAALDKKNKWTIYAAWAILAILITGTAFHIFYRLNDLLAEDIVCMAVAVFVIWGRKKLPTIKHEDTIKAEAEEAERKRKEKATKEDARKQRRREA